MNCSKYPGVNSPEQPTPAPPPVYPPEGSVCGFLAPTTALLSSACSLSQPGPPPPPVNSPPVWEWRRGGRPAVACVSAGSEHKWTDISTVQREEAVYRLFPGQAASFYLRISWTTWLRPPPSKRKKRNAGCV